MQKKKRIGQMFFVLATCCTLNSHGRGEHCSPVKNHKDTFLIVFFSLVRKERKGQKEERFPLLNSFRRLAATGANIASEPSHHSLSIATGSKR